MARRLTRLLAATFPSLAVLATAHELYLRNQQDLDQTLSVLLPFWAAAAAAVLATLLLQAAERLAPARLALCLLYTGGVAFPLWTFLRALPAGDHLARWTLDTPAGAALFATGWIGAAATVARGPGPRALEPLLAVLAVLFAGRDAASFATRLDRRLPPPPADVAAAVGEGDATRPNVYHFLFDALPDDLLETCWADAGAGPLDGFVRFHARSPSRATLNVLPLLFSGRSEGSGSGAALGEAMTGEASLMRALKGAGYRTVAFVPRYGYEGNRAAFDVAVFHEQNVREHDLRGLHRAVFLRLWAFVVLPRSLGEALAAGRVLGVDRDFFRAVDVERLSSRAQPIVSRLSAESLLALEPRLPARGRYTFVHLLIPHNPYVLRADCTYAGVASAPAPTDLREQTACGLRLLGRFLETLRRLGRLDGSVVLVHGDHGSGETLRDGRLVADEDAWLRTCVLVKPAGARGPLRRARAVARPVDLAPTLLALLDVPSGARRDGRVLDEALAP